MKIPKYIVFKVDITRKGTSVEITDITEQVEDVIFKEHEDEFQTEEVQNEIQDMR